MTPEAVSSAPRSPGVRQLRRMHGVYAAGTALWTLSLFVALLGHDADVRQILVLLALLAAFALMWLWSAWQLWTGAEPEAARPES
ncbi:hypothetical protein ACF1A5_04130 [Streptomyces sp. NPDC014864]|uniref:hypothetical protein n=1 Tax=Streptomyces sp. NPDC014864 TaxID=3364924 RepID=UPI003700C913